MQTKAFLLHEKRRLFGDSFTNPVCAMLRCFGYYAGEQVYAVLSHVADALLAAEGKLNELDNLAGDGDCGSTLSRGASGT